MEELFGSATTMWASSAEKGTKENLYSTFVRGLMPFPDGEPNIGWC